jgi:ribosomal protein S13
MSFYLIKNLSKKNGYNFRFLKRKDNFLDQISKSKDKIKEIENIKFLILIKNFKGLRHNFNFPARGQRTRTNAKNAKRGKN